MATDYFELAAAGARRFRDDVVRAGGGAMAITREPVTSGWIKGIGYDNGRIEIETANGRIYHGDCTPEEHAKFLEAESKGSHFNTHFKGRLALKPAEEKTEQSS